VVTERKRFDAAAIQSDAAATAWLWNTIRFSMLKNQRHEKFCQALVSGKTAADAYEEAGYTPNRRNAWILKTNQDIINRIAELQGQNQTYA